MRNIINPLVREMVYIHVDRIVHSNVPKQSKVDFIAAHFDWSVFGVVPVYQTKKGYLLTDGNHRVEAAKAKGFEWIPCIVLCKAEFDRIKFSKLTADVIFKIPEKPKYIK